MWTDIPLATTGATRGGSPAGTLPGTQLRSYVGPCGGNEVDDFKFNVVGPANYYRITVYAMPTATITYTLGNKRGNTIDSDFRAMAVDVSTPIYVFQIPIFSDFRSPISDSPPLFNVQIPPEHVMLIKIAVDMRLRQLLD